MLREKYEKAQTFQSYGFFLTHFTWNISPSIHKPWMNSHITEQVWENTGNSQVLLYPTDLKLMKTHAIPSVWECTNSHNLEIFCGKPYHSQVVGFWRNLGIFVWVHGKQMGIPTYFPFMDQERFFMCIHTFLKTWEK